MRRYQLLTIIDPTVAEKDLSAAQRSLERVVEQHGGHVEQSPQLEKVKLATPMYGHARGWRGIGTVVMPENAANAVQRDLRHKEGVLRSMMVRDDDTLSQRGTATPGGRGRGARRERPRKTLSDKDIVQEINAVIEREVEEVSRQEERAQEDENAQQPDKQAVSEEELKTIDDQLDEMLGE